MTLVYVSSHGAIKNCLVKNLGERGFSLVNSPGKSKKGSNKFCYYLSL